MLGNRSYGKLIVPEHLLTQAFLLFLSASQPDPCCSCTLLCGRTARVYLENRQASNVFQLSTPHHTDIEVNCR